MKKCPACDKTFDDGMRFCQTDGSALVEVKAEVPQDPYKTTVGNQEEILSAIPLDPLKTMVVPLPPKEEKEILELPDEPDFLKTMVSPPLQDLIIEPDIDKKEEIGNPLPPMPFSKPENLTGQQSSGLGSETPRTNEAIPPTGNEFSSGDMSSTPNPSDMFSNQSPFSNQSNQPIPSPFEESMFGYQAPIKPPFDAPKTSSEKNTFNQQFSAMKEAEAKAEALNTPYAEQVENQFNQPLEQSNWTPPPVPDANWQNQQIGQNSPFQPPAAGTSLNQTLPIVSLILGIVSLCCYISPLTGIGALVTGYLGLKNISSDPQNYGGKTMAIIGMILGGLFLLVGLLYYIFWLIIGFSAIALPN